jgi:hypothetical protein
VCVCVYASMYACMYVYLCIHIERAEGADCMYVGIHTYIHLRIHKYTCLDHADRMALQIRYTVSNISVYEKKKFKKKSKNVFWPKNLRFFASGCVGARGTSGSARRATSEQKTICMRAWSSKAIYKYMYIGARAGVERERRRGDATSSQANGS